MTRTHSWITLLVTLAAATLLFWIVLHQISSVWLDVALRPEVRETLERSMEDQKSLRRLDPARRDAYRKNFEETRTLLNRIEVLRHNREAMLRRFEIALIVVFALVAAIASAVLWSRYRRAQERERSEYRERVTSLQEIARRHAHEIRGPITAARLEMERLAELARAGAGDDEISRAQESITEELARVNKFISRAFTSFAGLGAPVLHRESLGELAREFCTLFANAWPGVALHPPANRDATVCADRDMVRQVLVDLCSNSAQAGAKSITFAIAGNALGAFLDLRDDGGGVPETLRARVFDPYVTTRKIGEGMGLGLSISRKVMLDHGGDLQLAESSPSGTTFRLVFGAQSCS